MLRGIGNNLFLKMMILMVMISGGITCSAGVLDYQSVERSTLRLYNEKKWDSVVIIGKEALREDIDYYYLRLRIGVSYYNLEKYFQAIGHLNKALKFNSLDPVVSEYLYYSYIRTNRTAEAAKIAERLSAGKRQAMNIRKNPVEKIILEGGPILSSDNDRAPSDPGKENDSISYSEEDLYGNSYYVFGGVKLPLFSSVSCNFGITYLDFKKIKNISYSYVIDQLDSTVAFPGGYSNFYSFPLKKESNSFTYNIHQFEASLITDIVLPRQFIISPAFHLVRDSYTEPVAKFSTVTVLDTAWVDQTVHTFPFTTAQYTMKEHDTVFYNYLGSLRVTKSISGFGIGLTISVSNFNGPVQKQAEGSLTWYPLGDLSLYVTTSLTGFFQKKEKRLIIHQAIGGNPWKELWLDGYFTYGDLTNANTGNGAVVYNNTGKIKYMAGGTATWNFRHFSVYAGYTYAEKESELFYYETKLQGETFQTVLKTDYNRYKTNTITAGLKWKF